MCQVCQSVYSCLFDFAANLDGRTAIEIGCDRLYMAIRFAVFAVMLCSAVCFSLLFHLISQL